MPEHVHAVLSPPTTRYDIRRILVALTRPVSDAAREHLDRTGQTRWLDRRQIG